MQATEPTNHTDHTWLKVYRTLVMLLLSIVSVVVLRMYNMIAEDHDLNIMQQGKIDALQKLEPKVEQIQQDVITLKQKVQYAEPY